MVDATEKTTRNQDQIKTRQESIMKVHYGAFQVKEDWKDAGRGTMSRLEIKITLRLVLYILRHYGNTTVDCFSELRQFRVSK